MIQIANMYINPFIIRHESSLWAVAVEIITG